MPTKYQRFKIPAVITSRLRTLGEPKVGDIKFISYLFTSTAHYTYISRVASHYNVGVTDIVIINKRKLVI